MFYVRKQLLQRWYTFCHSVVTLSVDGFREWVYTVSFCSIYAIVDVLVRLGRLYTLTACLLAVKVSGVGLL